MSFLNHAVVVDGIPGLVVNWWIQSALLIGAGLAFAAVLRRKGAAVQSAVYRIVLVAVLIAPAATWVWTSAGVTGWSIQTATAVVTTPAASAAASQRAGAELNREPSGASAGVVGVAPQGERAAASPFTQEVPRRGQVSQPVAVESDADAFGAVALLVLLA